MSAPTSPGRAACTVRVVLPAHLRRLAGVDGEIVVEVPAVTGSGATGLTQGALLDALEARHPVLRGTIREHGTLRRRAFVRFFACGEDLSHDPPGTPLPEPVTRGVEPFLVVGAMAGG
ncbi:MAG TPA: MoaD/ThiS family protein [Pseudonocardia sp.]|nr:MoaD/ThiS family protein [Pseudonocardia sp.]